MQEAVDLLTTIKGMEGLEIKPAGMSITSYQGLINKEELFIRRLHRIKICLRGDNLLSTELTTSSKD